MPSTPSQKYNMANPSTISRATTSPTIKRRKLLDNHHSLLPGLPDHIAHLCLSLISPATLFSVCKSWRRLIYSHNFPPFRSLYTISLPTTTVDGGGDVTRAGNHNQTIKIHSFDPISSKWITIDSPPQPYLHRISVTLPSFIRRYLPIQSLSISGELILLAGTSTHRDSTIPAFPDPIIFDPLSNTWSTGPPLDTPRRWCAAGVLQETVVVASGIGSHYTETTAQSVDKWVLKKIESFDEKRNGNCEKIRSFESFDLRRHENNKKIPSLRSSKQKMETFHDSHVFSYQKIHSEPSSPSKIESFDRKRHENREKIQSLRNSRVQNEYGKWEKMKSLKNPKLCREAIDMVGYKKKLYMVNVKGDYAKEGFVYNLDSDEWSEMPVGMLGGWKGPATAMEEETLYVVDETKGVLKRYNDENDSWSEIVVDERLKGAEYIAAGGGKVCVVCENRVGILVMDVAAVSPRFLVVATPPEHEVLGVHILPRMCLPEFQIR
uniref:F-box/kelch-repeat protein SKIP25-like n=1 Tax=Erigeron canadensis TaxID=72917 RepID=UPI001CB8C936|nr:F-box/kelch-repeat protein SKIP25-like [Erigeron canadensis]